MTGSTDGIRFSWRVCYDELGIPRNGHRITSVVLSSAIDRWQRMPPKRAWWEPLTLADVDRLWQEFQREWVHRLSATHVVADSAGHFVHVDAPHLVALMINPMVAAARDEGSASILARWPRQRAHCALLTAGWHPLMMTNAGSAWTTRRLQLIGLLLVVPVYVLFAIQGWAGSVERAESM
jgi:hypothetical protein